MSDVIVAPHQRDLQDCSATLGKWLRLQQPDASDVEVTNLTYPRGAGQSHETILFDVNWTIDGLRRTDGLVVRIKPGEFTVYPDDLFLEQYRVMQVMQDLGHVPVAEPLWLEEDPAWLGAPFFVMRKVAGRVPVSIPPYAQSGWVLDASPEQRRRLWENGVRALAAIQHTPLDAVRFLEGPEHAREGLEQEFDKFSRVAAWVQADHALPVLDAALQRLREQWPANRPAGIVWGDARIGNMMFDHDFAVTAVMDWEQPSLGGALNDLAWWITNAENAHGANGTRPHLAGMGTREETIELWEAITGLSAEGLEWYEDFTRLKMSCLGIRMAALRGQPLPTEAALAVRLKVA